MTSGKALRRARHTVLTAEPLHGVAREASSPDSFRCEGREPTFRLRALTGVALPCGRIAFSGHCDRRGADLFATLIAVDSQGNEHRFAIPTTRAGRIEHVLRLPDVVIELRFMPLEGPGHVTLRSLAATRLTGLETVARMAGWIAFDLWTFRGTAACTDVGLDLKRALTDLDGAYAASANLRAFPPRVPAHVRAKLESERTRAAASDALARLAKDPPCITLVISGLRATAKELHDALVAVESQTRLPIETLVVVTPGSAVSEVVEGRHWHGGLVRVASPNEALDAVGSGSLLVHFSANEGAPVPDALALLEATHRAHPGAAVVTTDEVCVANSGEAVEERCRGSAWNAERIEASLRVGTLTGFSMARLHDVGGMRCAATGEEAFDATLRLSRAPAAFQAVHVPHALAIARRAFDDRTPEETLAAHRSLAAHHAATSGAAVRPGLVSGTAHVTYPLPEALPKVSILIPSRDAFTMVHTCIESLRAKTAYGNYEIVIVDNGSRDDDAVTYLRELERSSVARVLRYDAPFNYSAMNNLAVRATTGKLLAFLNNDLEFIDDAWLTEMAGHALRPEVGVVGAKLLYKDGFVQHAGLAVGIGGVAEHVFRLSPGDHPGPEGRLVLARSCSAVTGACLVMRRDAFARVGGFDEVHLSVAYNDVDLCLKARAAGLRVLWTPHACLVHHESYSRGSDRKSPSSRRRAKAEMAWMQERWGTDTHRDVFEPRRRS